MSPVIDLSYEEVACWLTEPVADPIAFENWIGNRLYGIEAESENKEWESALMRAKLFKIKPTLDEALKEINDLSIILDAIQPVGILQVGEWGTLICPIGQIGSIDKTAAEVNGTKIPYDEIFILKVPKGETQKLKVKLNGDLRIDKKNNFTVDVTGGETGIIIDTRGRPFKPTPEKVKKWQSRWQK